MRFRIYDTDTATLKEWAKQLNVLGEGNYTLYATVENTLNHWKDELNKNIGVNTFSVTNSTEGTIKSWKDKLNGIYNI